MSEKVFGITKNILSCQLKKYEVDMVDLVIDVSKLESLLKACNPNNDFKKVVSSNNLIEWAEKEAKKK